jgi:hypothetical protein
LFVLEVDSPVNTEAKAPLRPNPFASLLDAVSVLAICAESTSLRSLPRSARRDADQPSRTISAELAEHDAAIEAAGVEDSAKRTASRRQKGRP